MKRKRMVGKNEHYCWWCNNRLMLPRFAEVETDYGKKLRVHKQCWADAEHFWVAARRATDNSFPMQSK